MQFSTVVLFLLGLIVVAQGVCNAPVDYVFLGGIEGLAQQASLVVYGTVEEIGRVNCSSGELEPLELPLLQGQMFDTIVQLKCTYSNNEASMRGLDRILVTGFGSDFDCLSSVEEGEEYIIFLEPSTGGLVCGDEEDQFALPIYLARYDYIDSAVIPPTDANLEFVEAAKPAKACAEVTISDNRTTASAVSEAASTGSPASAISIASTNESIESTDTFITIVQPLTEPSTEQTATPFLTDILSTASASSSSVASSIASSVSSSSVSSIGSSVSTSASSVSSSALASSEEGVVVTGDDSIVEQDQIIELDDESPELEDDLEESNFTTFDQIQCLLPADTGICEGHFTRYYFDAIQNQCLEFTYGGCEGNLNKFDTLEDCEKNCGDIENSEIGKKFYSNLEILDEEEQVIPVCERPSKRGSCKAFFPKFYYDSVSESCEEFVYGGCFSNGNNFFTEMECQIACSEMDK